MVGADITLQNSNVRWNSKVKLNGASVTYNWKNITKSDPVPGKYDTVEAYYGGFENPRIVINGYIDVNANPLYSGSACITQNLLMDFAQEGASTTYLVVSTGTETSGTAMLNGRPTAGYSVGGTYLPYLKVQIDGFTLNTSANDSREGHFWNYSIEMHETP